LTSMQNRNYPHPVLSADSSDFKEGITFDLDISVESNGVEYKFNYVFTLNADNMLQMISESKSIFIIKVFFVQLNDDFFLVKNNVGFTTIVHQ